MNILVLVALAVIAILAILGYKRGLIMSVWHLGGVAVILLLTIMLSPILTGMLKGSDRIYNSVYNKVSSTINISIKTGDDCDEYIKSLNLPKAAEEKILEAASDYYEDAETKQQDIVNAVYAKVTNAILSGIGFLVTFILVTIIANIAVRLLDLLSKAPILNTANKTGGLLLGIAEGILIVWIFCGILPVFSTSPTGAKLIEYVNESALLSFLYEKNFISVILSAKALK